MTLQTFVTASAGLPGLHSCHVSSLPRGWHLCCPPYKVADKMSLTLHPVSMCCESWQGVKLLKSSKKESLTKQAHQHMAWADEPCAHAMCCRFTMQQLPSVMLVMTKAARFSVEHAALQLREMMLIPVDGLQQLLEGKAQRLLCLINGIMSWQCSGVVQKLVLKDRTSLVV